MSAPSSELDHTFLDKAAPVMSANYFAHLFATQATQSAVGATFSFAHELLLAALHSSTDVAHAKLNWWQDEVQRVVAGEARHPLCTVLMAHFDDRGELARLMAEQVGTALQLSSGTHFDDLAAFAHHNQHRFGAAVAMLSRVTRGTAEVAGTFGRKAGTAVGFAHAAVIASTGNTTGVLSAAGAQRMPAERLAEESLTLMRDALDALPTSARPRQRSALVLLALHRETLKQLRQNNYTAQPVETGWRGIYRMLLAWQCAWAAQRQGLPHILTS